jgi:hypothetical protein
LKAIVIQLCTYRIISNVQTNFGEELHIPKQENKFIQIWVSKLSLSELHH